MVVEVILRQVREHQRTEANEVEPVLRGRMRGRLDRAAPIARVEHLPERALKVDRRRRRVLHTPALAPDAALDRTEQSRPPSGSGQHRVEQERRGRLPVRPRDTGYRELAGGPPEEHVRRRRHRGARIRDEQLRDGQVEPPLDDQRDGSPRKRVRRVVVTVGAAAGHAEEQRPGPNLATVEGEVADHDVRAGPRARRPDGQPQGLQLDEAGF